MAVAMKGLALAFAILIVAKYCDAEGKNQVVELDEDNWDQILKDEWMVEFYAPWCPACRALQPIWAEFASWGEELGVKVGQADVTTSPGLSGRFIVTALPTIYHVLDGEFRQYHGSRDKEAFMSFVEQKKWERVEPIPSWKSPGSWHMGAAAYFFKLSQSLRAVHNRLMEEYGLPTWGSYIIFAIVTIFLGALLGLLMVCIIDHVYPPRGLDAYNRYAMERARAAEGDLYDAAYDAPYNAAKDDQADENNSQDSQDERVSKSSGEEEEEYAGKNSPPSTPGTPSKRQRRPRKAD